MIAVMLVMMMSTRQADIASQSIPTGGIRSKSSQPTSVYRRGPNFFRAQVWRPNDMLGAWTGWGVLGARYC